MLYKSSASTNILITEKMATTAAAAAVAPLAIGTRGTVGSLVRREIEYFRRLELDPSDQSSKKTTRSKSFIGISNNHSATSTSTRSNSRSKTGTLGSFLTMSWRRKKRRNSSSTNNCHNNNNGFLPSMCSAVEVSESKRFDGIPGFSYRSLRADIQKAVD